MLTPLKIRQNLIAILIIVSVLSGCRKLFSLDDANSNPETVFNELWKIMDERYALFNIKQVDWVAVRNKYASKIREEMSSEELFRVCADMLLELRDGHVTLSSAEATSTYAGFFELYPRNFNRNIVLDNYLKGQYQRKGPFIYRIDRGVAYLYCESFETGFSESDLEGIMRFFEGTKGLILDVRGNTGGQGNNVNRLASYFIDQRGIVKYERFKTGMGHNSFTDPQPFSLEPVRASYQSPVVLLTNRTCFSACNDFVLYLSRSSRVTTVGDQTGGGGSVPANYVLGNGWKLQFSSTITLSPDKKPVEDGILPSIRINISPIDEVNGLDPIIEKAFALLQ